jgi:hypothetical protein
VVPVARPGGNNYHDRMVALAAISGTLIVAGVLLEAFETIVLPRRVTRRFRFTRGFYRITWAPWSASAARAA